MCPVCLTNAALIAAGATSERRTDRFYDEQVFQKEKTNQARGRQNENKRDGTRKLKRTKSTHPKIALLQEWEGARRNCGEGEGS
jgi:hypothetical protein